MTVIVTEPTPPQVVAVQPTAPETVAVVSPCNPVSDIATKAYVDSKMLVVASLDDVPLDTPKGTVIVVSPGVQ